MSRSLVAQGIYDRLNDVSVTALAPIFDEVPEGQNYPYIVIGDLIERADNRAGNTKGKDFLLDIKIWSDYRGWKKIDEIADAIETRLDNQTETVAVTGWNVNLLNFEGMTKIRAATFRQGIMRFRINVVDV